MKKITMMLLCIALLLTTAGCGKEENNNDDIKLSPNVNQSETTPSQDNSEKNSTTPTTKEKNYKKYLNDYVKEVDYETFMNAYDHQVNEMVIYVFEDDAIESQVTLPILSKYAVENRHYLFIFNAEEYLYETVDRIDNLEKYTGFNDYKKEICSKQNDDGTFTELFTNEECVEAFREKVYDDYASLLAEQIGLTELNSVLYIRDGAYKGRFEGFINGMNYEIVEKEEQEAQVKESTALLTKWLNAVYNHTDMDGNSLEKK